MRTQQHNADALPDDVSLRLVRRSAAEQDRHVNLARIADALEEMNALRRQENGWAATSPAAADVTLRALLRKWAGKLIGR